MGDFLRDAMVEFRTIAETELDQINTDLTGLMTRANRDPQAPQASITYILRYDGMGIIRKDFNEIKRAFGLAKDIERIVFRLDTPISNLNKGKTIDLHLDALDRSNCYLRVADDDEAWVDTTFRQLSSRLEHYKNQNSIPHSPVVELFIQLVGVFGGFFICLVAANVLTPKVPMRHSFFIAFIGFFLVFSNLWTYLLMLIGKLRNRHWPFVSFKKAPLGLLGQTVIGFILTAVLTLLLERSLAIMKQVGSLVVNP